MVLAWIVRDRQVWNLLGPCDHLASLCNFNKESLAVAGPFSALTLAEIPLVLPLFSSHTSSSVKCICFQGLNLLRQCPKCSANPITVTPIWKWEFANGKHPIEGLYRTFSKKILFKLPFSHKRFQMGQKMYFYQLYKL